MSSEKILVVCDHVDKTWIKIAKQRPDCLWKVFPLGVTVGRYRRALGEALDEIGATVLDIGRYAEDAQECVRGSYPGFIYKALRQSYEGVGSILDALRFGSINLWWLTDTSEKSPLRTPFITELYQIALLDRVLAAEGPTEVWVSVLNAPLANVFVRGMRERGVPVWQLIDTTRTGIRAWLTGMGPFSFWTRAIVSRIIIAFMWIGNRLVLRAANVTAEVSDDGRSVALLYSRYPALYADAFSFTPRDRYFRYLEDSLALTAQVWHGVALSLWPWELWSRRREIKRVFRTYRIVPLELYNTWLDLARAVLSPPVFTRLWRCVYRVLPRSSVTFEGWNILPLWNFEVRRSLSGQELVSDLLLLSSVRRLVRKNQISVVIHACEFQPMERAIWFGIEGWSRSVAFQHSTVFRNTLGYFFAPGEIRSYVEKTDPDGMPLPDFFVATGEYPFEVMRKNGFPESRLGLCGALRYNNLRQRQISNAEQSDLRSRLGLPCDSTIILVTLSSDHAEAIELLENLVLGIRHFSDRIYLVFKCHYHCRVEAEIVKRFERFNGGKFWSIVDVDAPLYEYMLAADAVLLTNSTTVMEAMALARVPVVFQNPSIFNPKSMSDIRDSVFLTSTPEELRSALLALAERSDRLKEIRWAWQETIRRAFYRLDGKADVRFIEFLEEKGLIDRGASWTRGRASVTGPGQ